MRDILFTVFTFIAVGLLATACPLWKAVVPGNECPTGESRCYADNKETCGTDRRWRIEIRCPERGENIICDDSGEVVCKEAN